MAYPMDCLAYSYLPFTEYRNTFSPAAGDIYCAEGVQVEALDALAAMSHQVNLQKTGLVLLPVGKSPDGYRLLKQASRLGSGKSPTPSQPAVWPQ